METGEHVGLRRVGDGNKGVHILEPFVFEELYVGGITIDDEGVLEQGSHLLATGTGLLEKGDTHAVLKGHGGITAYTARTDNHHLLHLGLLAVACGLLDTLHLVGPTDDIDQVALLEDCVGVGNDRHAVAQDSHNARLKLGIELGKLLDAVLHDR